MKRTIGRIGLLLLATSFSVMALSSPALAKKDPQIKALEEEIKFIKKNLLKPADKADDKELVALYREQIKELKEQIQEIKASNKL
jgi:hypothetical protein